jgi:hypothetical protein
VRPPTPPPPRRRRRHRRRAPPQREKRKPDEATDGGTLPLARPPRPCCCCLPDRGHAIFLYPFPVALTGAERLWRTGERPRALPPAELCVCFFLCFRRLFLFGGAGTRFRSPPAPPPPPFPRLVLLALYDKQTEGSCLAPIFARCSVSFTSSVCAVSLSRLPSRLRDPTSLSHNQSGRGAGGVVESPTAAAAAAAAARAPRTPKPRLWFQSGARLASGAPRPLSFPSASGPFAARARSRYFPRLASKGRPALRPPKSLD